MPREGDGPRRRDLFSNFNSKLPTVARAAAIAMSKMSVGFTERWVAPARLGRRAQHRVHIGQFGGKDGLAAQLNAADAQSRGARDLDNVGEGLARERATREKTSARPEVDTEPSAKLNNVFAGVGRTRRFAKRLMIFASWPPTIAGSQLPSNRDFQHGHSRDRQR